MEYKKCCTCGENKLTSDFNKNKSTKDGLHKQCKICLKDYRTKNAEQIAERTKEYIAENFDKRAGYLKEYRVKNKERLKQYHQEYRENNKELLKVKHSEKYARVKRDSPASLLWYSAKQRARINNLAFDIEKEDIVIPEFCPILGIKLESSSGSPSDSSPSLDKIVPSLGYTKGNVQVISHRANLLKNNATIDELLLLSEWIMKTFKGVENDNQT